MFTIIGGDGREYGPVSSAEIRAWLAAGRANLETQARAEGAVEWRPLGDYPEFDPSATETLATVEVPESDLAERGTRLLAKLVDEVCSLLAALPGALMLGVATLRAIFLSARGGAPAEEISVAANLPALAVLLAGLLAITIVQIWMISTRGQTIGKRVFGVRIVRVADGALPGFVHGWLLRSFVPGLFSLFPFSAGFIFSIVDLCFIFRRDRRCVHDLIAGTRVVKA